MNTSDATGVGLWIIFAIWGFFNIYWDLSMKTHCVWRPSWKMQHSSNSYPATRFLGPLAGILPAFLGPEGEHGASHATKGSQGYSLGTNRRRLSDTSFIQILWHWRIVEFSRTIFFLIHCYHLNFFNRGRYAYQPEPLNISVPGC